MRGGEGVAGEAGRGCGVKISFVNPQGGGGGGVDGGRGSQI